MWIRRFRWPGSPPYAPPPPAAGEDSSPLSGSRGTGAGSALFFLGLGGFGEGHSWNDGAMSLAGAARSLVALASRRQCKPSAASAAALPVKPLPNRPFGTARSEAAREAAERAVPNGALDIRYVKIHSKIYIFRFGKMNYNLE